MTVNTQPPTQPSTQPLVPIIDRVAAILYRQQLACVKLIHNTQNDVEMYRHHWAWIAFAYGTVSMTECQNDCIGRETDLCRATSGVR